MRTKLNVYRIESAPASTGSGMAVVAAHTPLAARRAFEQLGMAWRYLSAEPFTLELLGLAVEGGPRVLASHGCWDDSVTVMEQAVAAANKLVLFEQEDDEEELGEAV